MDLGLIVFPIQYTINCVLIVLILTLYTMGFGPICVLILYLMDFGPIFILILYTMDFGLIFLILIVYTGFFPNSHADAI